jgi:predicted DNA-binding transcriptional regulator AlpA
MSKKSTPPVGNLPATGYVRQSQLIPAIVPFSLSTLWRNVKAGVFPAPVKLSDRVTAWRVEDIRAWMNSRTANDKGKPIASDNKEVRHGR